MTLTLRPATLEDVPLLIRWDEQPHVIACTGSDDAVDWVEELAEPADWQQTWIAEVAGRPVGVVQVIDPARESSQYWGEIDDGLRAIDIWLGEERDLGRGYGSLIMRDIIDRCFADPGVEALLVDPLASNTRAHRFYERLGFHFVEARRFGSDDCFVYRLERGD